MGIDEWPSKGKQKVENGGEDNRSRDKQKCRYKAHKPIQLVGVQQSNGGLLAIEENHGDLGREGNRTSRQTT